MKNFKFKKGNFIKSRNNHLNNGILFKIKKAVIIKIVDGGYKIKAKEKDIVLLNKAPLRRPKYWEDMKNNMKNGDYYLSIDEITSLIQNIEFINPLKKVIQ